MHGTFTSGSLTSDLIHFTTSLLITLLLLILTVRAARLPGTPVANILFAVCGILWSAGGLWHVAQVAGYAASGTWRVSHALQFSGAAAFPVAMLAVWMPWAARRWQQRAMRGLLAASIVSAAAIVALLWFGNSAIATRAAVYTDAILLAAGAAVGLRRNSTPRAVYLLSLVIVLALSVAVVASLAPGAAALNALAAHLILLMVLCAFVLFARFRFADVFIRYAVRFLLAAFWAGTLAAITSAPASWRMVRQSPSPMLIHVCLLVLAINAMWLSFAFVDQVSRLINRWLFRAPDYRAEARTLANQLRELEHEIAIAAAVEQAARGPLELSEARIVPLDETWLAAVREGDVVERGIEVLVPVFAGGRFAYVLAATPGPTRPGLVSNDIDYLRGIALQFGNRLDALVRERDAIDRQSREALLIQQVTEAELRALRAQINPHFLFNSLNTVADLIVRDPARAEAMTLRLASVFRHVLAHSSRPLTTMRDEIDFLRTYLYIEEARFGDRLRVHIDVDDAVLAAQVPSLILQPLVENALKHGFGPKPGPGNLWISARVAEGELRVVVEDDGMGLSPEHAPGVGLTNVAERLTTLYQDRGSLRLEPRRGGGCRATLRIPRNEVLDE